MIGVFEFIITIILVFILVVYAIYSDIKSDVKKQLKKKDYKKDCKRKCTKPKNAEGNCYHPIKYNAYLKKNQEVKSQLICPWSCSSGYSNDPTVCQYDQDCSGCTPAYFDSIDSACPNSTYGCCGDGKTDKTDEFGNNCLGLTGGATGSTELFTTYEQVDTAELSVPLVKIPHQIYPACPNISCPNENAFNKDSDYPPAKETNLETLPSYQWASVSE